MYGNDMVLTKEQIAAALAALDRDVEYFTSCGTNPQSTRMMIAARRDLLMENAGEHRALVWAHMEHAAKPTEATMWVPRLQTRAHRFPNLNKGRRLA